MYRFFVTKKRLVIPLLFLLFFITNSNLVFAAGENTLKEENNKHIIVISKDGSLSDTLFTVDDGPFSPGYVKTKSFYIRNPYSFSFSPETVGIAMDLKRISGQALDNNSTEYRDFIKYMRARIESNGIVLYDGNFGGLLKSADMIQDGVVISPNADTKFDFKLWLDDQASEAVENLECNFDLSLQFKTFDGTPSESTNIPNTGSFIDAAVILSIGAVFITLGIILIFTWKNTKNSSI